VKNGEVQWLIYVEATELPDHCAQRSLLAGISFREGSQNVEYYEEIFGERSEVIEFMQ